MSNSDSTIGLPLLIVSSSASSARVRRARSAASRKRMRPRSCAVTSAHGPVSNARRAAATASVDVRRVGVGNARNDVLRRRIDDVDASGRCARR